MKKIGLYGGTFDPIHVGHLITARHVREQFELDCIIYIPSGNHPFKAGKIQTSPHMRFRMVSQAIGNNEQGVIVSSHEVAKQGTTYTIDTVKYFQDLYPNASLYWLIGGDLVKELGSWNSFSELVGLCQIITMIRQNKMEVEMNIANLYLKKLITFEQLRAMEKHMVHVPQAEISSGMIRDRVRKGQSVRWLVPDAVLETIEQNNLYKDGANDESKTVSS